MVISRENTATKRKFFSHLTTVGDELLVEIVLIGIFVDLIDVPAVERCSTFFRLFLVIELRAFRQGDDLVSVLPTVEAMKENSFVQMEESDHGEELCRPCWNISEGFT